MTARAVLTCVVVLLVAAPTPSQDTKKELDKLQGEWTMVSQENFGKKVPGEKVKPSKLTIKGDQWTMVFEKSTFTMTFKIDPSTEPKTIDFTIKATDMESASLGIYKLEGDTLTVCRSRNTPGAERPKDFKTTADDGVLVVYKRAKK